MKKFFVVSVMFLLAAFSVNAYALPFTSLGWINPNFNDSWDAATATGTARYTFSFDNPNVLVNNLELLFEGDIFDLTELDAGDFSMVAPAGWNTVLFSSGSGLTWSISSGVAISAASSPIVLDVNYTLLNANRYFFGNSVAAGDVNVWAWNEAQGGNSPWSQEYHLTGIYQLDSDQDFVATSGGSTSPVPEPATILLFGAALLGLVGLKRRKA